MRLISPLLIAAVLPLAACASRPGAGSESASPRYERNLISREEIEQAMEQNVTNLYDLVRSRRPAWLRQAPASVFVTGPSTQISVWMDRSRLGGLEALRNVPASIAQRIRYLSPSEAQSELGLDNVGGAIVVSTQENR